MPLKFTLTNDEFEKLDDNTKALYVQRDDQYFLDLEERQEDINDPNDDPNKINPEDQQNLIEAHEEALREIRKAMDKERQMTKKFRALKKVS